MNKLLRYTMLAGFVGTGCSLTAHADTDTGIQAGPVKINIGGFIEGAGIFRSRNETADVASSFTSIPFANNNNFYTSEFRESARQSRLQFLMTGPEDGSNKVEAFYAMDFLSAGVTSNSNQSNSYTMRVREVYGDWLNKDYGFYALAGQTWSMATLYKQGLTPRKEDVPMTIDAQYVVGFNWERQAQFRFVKTFGNFAALGISLEEPQDLIKGTAPSGVDATNTGGSGLNNGGTSSSTGATTTTCTTASPPVCTSTTTVTGTNLVNYSTDVAPDVIVKAAFDPGFGHYEIYSLTRFFHDRAEAIPGTKSSEDNNTVPAESIGGGAFVPVIPKFLDVQVSGLVGHGNGRYGTSTLADSVYQPSNGAPAPLKGRQALAGIIGHPTPRLDIYAYAGYEHDGTTYGYGIGDNSGCNVNFAASPKGACNGTVSTVREATAGFWWKFYKGPIGYLTVGAQGELVKISTFTDAAGYRGKSDDSIGMVSFRYYPFQ